MSEFLAILLGGRPMRVHSRAFVDVVTRRQVYRVVDRFGRWWLAESGWAFFRVPIRRGNARDSRH
jgi:hypothetical protein